MRFRKMRIAWSMMWGLAAALLIVFFVRSYSTVDSIRGGMFGRVLVHIQSGSGRIVAFTFPYAKEWRVGSFPIEHLGPRDVLSTAVTGSRYLPKFYVGFKPAAVVSYWAVLFGILVATVASLWPLGVSTWRFSLRTLLVATTLVAVVLGLIAWLR